MDKQENKTVSLQARPELAPTTYLSPNPSNTSSCLGERHSCFQLAEPVSRLPFRTRHLLSHQCMHDCPFLEGSSPLAFNTALCPFLLLPSGIPESLLGS